MNQVTVELVPHVGKTRKTIAGQKVELDVTHNQWMVMATIQGVKAHVGYLCKNEGSPFNGTHTLRQLPQEVQNQVGQAVNAKCGWEATMHIPRLPAKPKEE